MATVVKQTGVEWVTELADRDLEDLCEATEEAILDGNGFGWLTPPPRRVSSPIGAALCWYPSETSSWRG